MALNQAKTQNKMHNQSHTKNIVLPHILFLYTFYKESCAWIIGTEEPPKWKEKLIWSDLYLRRETKDLGIPVKYARMESPRNQIILRKNI